MIRLYLTAFLFAQSICLFAQSSYNPSFQNMIPVNTVAPDAAALGKFGNIPVSYATGIPSIAIPLTEISAGKLKIPLSLDYHAGGVRVDEVASSVGTGWALSGVPTLSRNMIGLPDEGSGGYLSSLSFDTLYNYMQGAQYGSRDMAYAQFVLDVRNKVRDTEPDVFSYSLNGSSGKFIYRPDGTIMQIPQTNNKIERVSGNNYKITDENGVAYWFDRAASTTVISQSLTYVSSWHVSRIVDQNMTDSVTFAYDGGISSDRSWSSTYTLGEKPAPCGVATQHLTELASSLSQTQSGELYPKEITWKNGKVTFKNAADRLDRTSNLRVDSVRAYSGTGAAYQLVMQAKLFQSYFFSNPIPGATADNRNYRLRLDSVAFSPVTPPNAPQTYRMAYKDIIMAPNESFGQDRWGYNNGQFSNPSLMPSQMVESQGTYLQIGNANRNADESYMQACMIESIQYPTKGRSVFEFEPHRYPLNYQEVQQQSTSCFADGGVQSQNSTVFTVSASQTAFRYDAYIAAYAGFAVSNRPKVELYDQTAGTMVFSVTNTNTVNNPSLPTNVTNVALNLVAGHTYMLSVNIYTSTSPGMSARGTVYWTSPVSGVTIRKEGGLRVKTITAYDQGGQFAGRESYEYGTDGTGSLLTQASYMLLNYEDVKFINWYGQNCDNGGYGGGGLMSNTASARIYYQNAICPASQFSGSPVVYDRVTKFNYNASNVPNGKSVFEYDVVADQAYIANSSTIGVWMLSNTWQNGFIKREQVFKNAPSGFSRVKAKGYSYTSHRAESNMGLKIKPIYVKMGSTESFATMTSDTRVSSGQYFVGRIPAQTAAILLSGVADTTYDDANNALVATSSTMYESGLHNLPTQTQAANSKAQIIAQELKYPSDFAASGNVYQKMLNRNILAPVVTSRETVNGSQTRYSKINYRDWFSDGRILMPESAEQQIMSNPIETRVKFSQFDTNGNILEQQKVNGPPQSYRWGYRNQYPVAAISGAVYKDTWYEGFEESAGNSLPNDAKTGHYSKTGGYSKSLSLLTPGTYRLTYWTKVGGKFSLTVSNNIAVGADGLYTISIPGAQVDDVCFYPASGQMTTYTYDPLVGMTSATDAKGMATYYEYDGFQRLMNVRDQDGNILKSYDYHYIPQ